MDQLAVGYCMMSGELGRSQAGWPPAPPISMLATAQSF